MGLRYTDWSMLVTGRSYGACVVDATSGTFYASPHWFVLAGKRAVLFKTDKLHNSVTTVLGLGFYV